MTTLATLRTWARSRADMPGTGFVTNAELDVWINEGIGAIHEKLVEAYGEDYLEYSTAITFDGTQYVDLPADFFKLLGVDILLNGTTYTLQPFTSRERNQLANQQVTVWPNIPKYKFSGADRIRVLPAPTNGTTGTLWYIPAATTLTSDSDSVSFPNGWETYAAIYAAVQMLIKEESNTDQLQAILNQWDRDLNTIAETRDAGMPKQAVDMEVHDWYFR